MSSMKVEQLQFSEERWKHISAQSDVTLLQIVSEGSQGLPYFDL